MILTLAGQSQRLSHMCTWKISRVFIGTQTHDLSNASSVLFPLSYEATQLWAGQFVGLMCSRKRNDEWKKSLWSVAKRWIEEMILTLARPSQRVLHMCHWKISGFFNKASCAVYFTSSIIIKFLFHSDLILENANDKDVAFLVVGDPFGWVISEYHYSKDIGTILTVDTKILSPLWILIVSLRFHHRKVSLDNFNPQCGEHFIPKPTQLYPLGPMDEWDTTVFWSCLRK